MAAVAAGKSFFSPAVAKVMLDDYVRHLADKGIADRYDALSEREREIFQLIAEGHSNKEIAELLSISPATVETHRAHILQKLDVHNTAELVLYAVRRGVISGEKGPPSCESGPLFSRASGSGLGPEPRAWSPEPALEVELRVDPDVPRRRGSPSAAARPSCWR